MKKYVFRLDDRKTSDDGCIGSIAVEATEEKAPVEVEDAEEAWRPPASIFHLTDPLRTSKQFEKDDISIGVVCLQCGRFDCC